jgi:hypothetical protein
MKISKAFLLIAVFGTFLGTASAGNMSAWTKISDNPSVQVCWETDPAGFFGGGPKIVFKSNQDVNVRYLATVEYDGGGYPSKRITKTTSGTTSVSRITGAVIAMGGTGQALVIKAVSGAIVK